MEIRELGWSDVTEVQRLRALLFPDEDLEGDGTVAEYLEGDAQVVGAFVGDALVGYAAAQIRSHAEGAWDLPIEQRRIAYLEEWYVEEDHRGRGVGRALVDGIRDWARATRSTHLASDALVDNAASLAAHLAVGFEEVETAVHFVERLPDPDPPREAPRGATVTLRPIDESTGPEVLRLHVAPNQSGFVAPNQLSLAQASFADHAWTRAVYADEVPVGFVLVSRKPERHFLWRMMIDARHQGRGYGRAAIERIATMTRESGLDQLYVSYLPGRRGPAGFYRGLGFVPTGEMHGDEVVAVLDLRDGADRAGQGD